MQRELLSSGWAAYANFAALPPEHADYEQARFVLLPVPYDRSTSYRPGARGGPRAIIEASHYLELYDEELQTEPYRAGIHTLPALEPLASGPEAMSARVEAVVGRLLAAGKLPILLGGEHSITIGAVRALTGQGEKLSVLQLDAHADLREEYEGTPFSHACVGRRIAERARLVQLGIRSLSAIEADYLHHAPITTVYAQEWLTDEQSALRALAELDDPVYITIDLDVFDPAIMPATGTPEPGGLDWQKVLRLLRRVCRNHLVLGADLVELAPLPGQIAPDFLVAKLVYKLIGYLSELSRGGAR